MGNDGGLKAPRLGGIGRFGDDIENSTDPTVARQVLMSNPFLQGIGRKLFGKNPTVAPLRPDAVGKATDGNAAAERYQIGHGFQRWVGENNAANLVKMIGNGEQFKTVFKHYDIKRGVFTKGVNRGKHLTDRNLILDRKAQLWLDDHDGLVRDMIGQLRNIPVYSPIDKGVEFGGRGRSLFQVLEEVEPGLFTHDALLPIVVRLSANGAGSSYKYVGAGKKPLTIKQYLDDGYKLLSPEEALFHRLERGYRIQVNNNALGWATKQIRMSPYTVPQIDIALTDTVRRAALLEDLAYNRIIKVVGDDPLRMAGEPFVDDIKSLIREFPEFGVELKLIDQTRFSPEDILNVVGKDAGWRIKQRRVLGIDEIVPRPGEVADKVAHSKSTIARLRKALNAALKEWNLPKDIGKTDVNAHAVVVATKRLTEATRQSDAAHDGIIVLKESKTIQAAFNHRRESAISKLMDDVLGKKVYKETALSKKLGKLSAKAGTEYKPQFALQRPPFKRGGALGRLNDEAKRLRKLKEEAGKDVQKVDIDLLGEAAFQDGIGAEFIESLRAIRKAEAIEMTPTKLRASLIAISTLNGLIKMINLGMDNSILFIQMLGFVFNHPAILARSGGKGLQSMFMPATMNKLMSKHADTVNKSRNLNFASRGGADYTDVLKPGGILYGDSKIKGVARWVLSPWERFYDTTLDASGIFLRESLVDDAVMSAKEIYDRERFINLFRGMGDRRLSGVSQTQSMLEGLAMLAPRYLWSSMALLGDLTRAGTSGNLARKKIGNLLAGTFTTLTLFDFYFWMKSGADEGRPPDETIQRWVKHIPDLYDARSPNFMRIRVGDNMYGFNPKVRSFTKMLAAIAEDPSTVLDAGMDNPVLRLLRYNASPILSTGITLSTGRNAIGEPIGSPSEFLKNLVVERTAPIWAGEMIGGTGDLSERVERSAADYVGIGSRPLTLEGSLDRFVHAMYFNSQGEVTYKTSPDRVFRWKDLEPHAQGKVRMRPDVKEIYRRYDRKTQHSIAQTVREEMQSRQVESDGKLAGGEWDGRTWVGDFFKSRGRQRGQSDVFEKLGIYEKVDSFDSRELEALNEYWELLNTLDTDGVEPDDFAGAIHQYFTKLESESPELASFVRRNRSPNSTEVMDEFFKLFELQRQVGWYTAHETHPMWNTVQQSTRDTYLRYLDSTINNTQKVWRRQPENVSDAQNIVDDLEAYSKDFRVSLRRYNPVLDGMLAYWYGNTPYSAHGIAEAVKVGRNVAATSGMVPNPSIASELRFMANTRRVKIDDEAVGALAEAGIDTLEDLASLTHVELHRILRDIGGLFGLSANTLPTMRDVQGWGLQGIARTALEYLT